MGRPESARPADPAGAPHRRLGRSELLLAALACVLAAAALYGPHVIRGGWYYDDWQFVAKLELADGDGPGALLGAAFDSIYRPGHALLWLGMYLIGGTGQAPYLAIGVGLTALEAALAYALARALGAPRAAAGAGAAMLIALPTIDATRLWPAAFPTTWAICLWLLGVLAALRGLSAPSRRGAVAWHAAALAAYALAILTAEIVAGLVPATAILYAAAGGRRRALRRWIADVAVAVAAVAFIAPRAGDKRPVDGSPSYVLGRVEGILAGARDVLRAAFPAPELTWGPAGLALLLAAGAGVALALRRGGAQRRAARGGLLAAAGGLVFALAGLLPLLPADPYYVPRVEGVGDRLSAAAALGEVTLLVALAFLLATGVTALVGRPRWSPVAAVLVAAVIVAGMVRDERRHQDPWAESWKQSQAVLSAVRHALGPRIPPGSAVVTYNHAGLLPGDVPVFVDTRDLQGAVRLLFRDPSLDGQPFNPAYSCEAGGLAVRRPATQGPPLKVLPYRRLYVVDAAAYRGRRITGRADCGRWRASLGI